MRTNLLALLMAMLVSSTVSAYSNATMTDEFRMLMYGDPIHAIQQAYTNIWGVWIWLLLTMTIYTGLLMYQQSLTIASVWMVFCLGAYGYLFEGLGKYNIVLFLAIVIWVLSALMRAVSPVWKE